MVRLTLGAETGREDTQWARGHNGAMCGRYANFLAEQDLIDAFAIATTADDARLIPPRYNIAPTQLVQIVRPGRENSAAR